jgi:CheY-like chemotaxis protein
MTVRRAVKHRVLIVEDDVESAGDLTEIVGSLGCESVTAASREDAAATLRKQQFCLILLDLQIKDKASSIKSHVEHGMALLRDIRQEHGERSGRVFWLPVVIVSGYAREVPVAVEMMKDGASDLIEKPLSSRVVSGKLRDIFRESGRTAHDLCLKGVAPAAPNASGEVILAITGDRVGRRTVVMVGQTRVELTDSCLRLLLQLMVARTRGESVHKRDLGANDEQGFKGISILRNELRPALGKGVDIIGNDHHGSYCLSDNVRIGACVMEALDRIGDRRITSLGAQLRSGRRKV